MAEKCKAKYANKKMHDKQNIDEQGGDLALAWKLQTLNRTVNNLDETS